MNGGDPIYVLKKKGRQKEILDPITFKCGLIPGTIPRSDKTSGKDLPLVEDF